MSLEAQIKQKRTEVQTLVNQAKTLHGDIEAKLTKSETVDESERTKLNNLIDDGEKKRAELIRLEQLYEADQHVNGDGGDRKTGVTDRQQQALERGWQSWGKAVIASEQYKQAKARAGDGRMDRTPVQGGVKALYGSTGATGGVLVATDVRPEILDIARQRPFTVLDAITMSETASDTVRYVEMDARTNNAAVVPEYTGGNFGLKPESNLTFNEREAAVKWIATWIAVHKQLLEDAPRLRDTIDNELDYMVRFHLEQQVTAGDGAGSNFLGMLNWPGIQLRAMHATTPVGRGQTTTDTKMTTLRRAITDIRLEFYEATGVMLNPVDSEDLEITEYSGNRYANAFDPVTMRIWRVPIIETQAIPALTALVGNFRLAATLWDRAAVEILVGQPNDFFLRNAVALLAELRAAFAVTRPKAIEKVTLIAS